MAEWDFGKGLSSFFTRTLQFNFSLKCWWKRSESSSHSSGKWNRRRAGGQKYGPLQVVFGDMDFRMSSAHSSFPCSRPFTAPFSSPLRAWGSSYRKAELPFPDTKLSSQAGSSESLGPPVCNWCTSGSGEWWGNVLYLEEGCVWHAVNGTPGRMLLVSAEEEYGAGRRNCFCDKDNRFLYVSPETLFGIYLLMLAYYKL